jgi:hypothetical protein
MRSLAQARRASRELEKLERALLAMSTARREVRSTQALKVIIET